MLHVRLIGTLEVRCDGDVVAITPRAIGVLVRLALAGGPVRRDRLLMDVWGEDVDPGRRRSLETLISELRRKVVSKAGIVFRGDTYELRVPVTVDVARMLSGERGVWSVGDELFVDRLGRSSWFERLEHQVDQMKAVLFDPSTARPDIQYANDNGRHIAYQDRDGREPAVLLLAGLVTHCEMLWDAPGFRAWVEASFGDRRLIMLDKRGSGLSDPIDDVPATQDFVDDIVSVLDACDARQVVAVCAAEAGLFGPQLIAADPGRFFAAVFLNAIPKMFVTDDYAPDTWRSIARAAERAEPILPSGNSDMALRCPWACGAGLARLGRSSVLAGRSDTREPGYRGLSGRVGIVSQLTARLRWEPWQRTEQPAARLRPRRPVVHPPNRIRVVVAETAARRDF